MASCENNATWADSDDTSVILRTQVEGSAVADNPFIEATGALSHHFAPNAARDGVTFVSPELQDLVTVEIPRLRVSGEAVTDLGWDSQRATTGSGTFGDASIQPDPRDLLDTSLPSPCAAALTGIGTGQTKRRFADATLDGGLGSFEGPAFEQRSTERIELERRETADHRQEVGERERLE